MNAPSEMLVDASQVYAEGMHAGLREAIRILARSNVIVPLPLRRKATEWEATAIHREWQAQQGRPVSYQRAEQVNALIHHVLRLAGLEISDVE